MSTSAASLSTVWSHPAARAVRALAPPLAIVGYVAGFSILPSEWYHLGWLLVIGCAALVCMEEPRSWLRWPLSPGALLTILFMLWMTARSCCTDAFMFGHAARESGRGLFGAALVGLLCVLLSQVAQERGWLRVVGWATGMAAAVAASISLVFSYFVPPGYVPGDRLKNLLVHGGLNPVCTGLGFGFAAVWLLGLQSQITSARARRVALAASIILHQATFFTGSRGAMLALVGGHLALFLTRGWRRGAAGLAVLVLTGVVYFASAPLMAKVATWRAPVAAVTVPGLAHHWQQAMERGDSGRLDIYRAGWNAIDNVWLGTGQWGVVDVWQCDLQPDPCVLITHLHSAFFATFVHGGIIGAALLLLLLVEGWRCAIRVARREDDVTWLALLAFGCGGLLFDGESLASLATAPRFEGLLFWVPLVVALTRGRSRAISSRAAS